MRERSSCGWQKTTNSFQFLFLISYRIMPNFIRSLLVFLLVVTFATSHLRAQVTLHGTITAKATGETLAGATVFIPDLKTGTAADKDGVYTLSNLPAAKLLVQVSFVGYLAVTRTIDLRVTTRSDFSLEESAIEAQEVVVTGNALSSDNSRSSISVTPIGKNQLITMPSTNLINAISSVPGLSEITTGGSCFKTGDQGTGLQSRGHAE
jgi:iron complex outermembrane recepter protein